MITVTENDDPRFVALASLFLDSAIAAHRPTDVYVIRIDKWFDVKWLNFSGKMLGALGHWHTPITIPPFHPNRVRAEDHFVAVRDSVAFLPEPIAPLHIAQSSDENFTRFISRVSPSAIFLWYSSSTLALDRGSLMLYRSEQDEVSSWYASFHRAPTWRLDRQQGISPTEIQRQLTHA